MKYYYYDLCAAAGEKALQEYADFNEFKEGLLWNRDIAKEYGDSVISKIELNKLWDTEFSVELNGAIFIACEDIKTFEDGAYYE